MLSLYQTKKMLKLKSNQLWKQLYSSSSSSSSPTETSLNYLSRQITLLLSTQFQTLISLFKSHSFIITSGHSNNPFIASKLISLYALINQPTSSTKVFNSIQYKDTFIWNSIIKAHFFNGNYSLGLEYFSKMRSFDVFPNDFTIPMVVSTSAEIESINIGKLIHGLVSKLGFFKGNPAVGSSFVYMYSVCGCMDDAGKVFDEMSVKDVVAWTALIIGYIRNDESDMGLKRLYNMHRVGGDDEKPNCRTLEGGFQACGDLGALLEGRCLHGLAIKTGIIYTQAVQSSVLSMYAKCGTPEDAYLSFCEVDYKDIISWTCIIGVYSRIGDYARCLWLLQRMQASGVLPDEILISCVISSFVSSMRAFKGKAFHAMILRRNFPIGKFVYNALLIMYCRFEPFSLADKVFRLVNDKDDESWFAMIIEYGKIGKDLKCLDLFREMQDLGIRSNSNCLLSAISSCSRLGAVNLGRSLHCHTVRSFKFEDVTVKNSLIDMYAKNGYKVTAERMFGSMEKDIVTWNTMISSYAQYGNFSEAFFLYDGMILEGFNPNEATIVTILSVCAHMASLEKGEEIHSYVKDRGYMSNLAVATGLVDMYSKCGKLKEAKEIFDSLNEKDIISWNVMISGYGLHGDAKSAIEIFQEMEKKSNIKPNELTFLAILSACNHAGLVEEGKQMLSKMRNYSISPTLKHYSCMVDLLARSGNLYEAESLVLSMPIAPDGGLWGALLSACKVYGDSEMGIRIAKLAIESDPENDGYYIILSDMYTCMERWDEAEKVRMTMKRVGLKKKAGWSSV